MDCKNFRELMISTFQDFRLSCQQIAEIRTHYRACEICHTWIDKKILFLAHMGFFAPEILKINPKDMTPIIFFNTVAEAIKNEKEQGGENAWNKK